jgi:hypothetical protein
MSHPHPYTDLPDHCFWSRVHGTGQPLDPVIADPSLRPGPQLVRSTRIVTAGSCFAQHIARHLRQAGFAVLDGEPAHPVISPDIAARFGYGVFSARYGNVYTARQMKQLIQRATGEFTPQDDCWSNADGALIDPFRPTIEPDGFSCAADFHADRTRHFAAVRSVLEQAEVLIFTLGLTEAWRARADGAVYPLAPGVAGGTFDRDVHEFVNFSVEETVADFTDFLALARRNNPDLSLILTVSPVPLAATARADAHVVSATSYSKAVLRVAAEQLAQADPAISYFPSYEIITSAQSRGRYFGDDLRAVERAGVRHVMDVFARHHAPDAAAPTRAQTSKPVGPAHQRRRLQQALDTICDEQRLDEVAT